LASGCQPEAWLLVDADFRSLQIELWRYGCIELSKHVENMTPNQRKVYETDYMGIDYDPNNTEMAEIINDGNDD